MSIPSGKQGNDKTIVFHRWLHRSDDTEASPGPEPNEVRGIDRLRDRVGLLALEGCQSTYRFFTRGPVIGGKPISLRASAVINQMSRAHGISEHDWVNTIGDIPIAASRLGAWGDFWIDRSLVSTLSKARTEPQACGGGLPRRFVAVGPVAAN